MKLPTALTPQSSGFAGINYMPMQSLVGSGMLMPQMRLGVEDHLYAAPPPSGILSERGYAKWTGLGCNVAAYYRTLIGRTGEVDRGAVKRIYERLVPSGEDGTLEYLTDMVAGLLTKGALEMSGYAAPDAKDLSDVYSIPMGVLGHFVDPWHKSLARYVVTQEAFEEKRPNPKSMERQSSILIKLYAWYIALAGNVSVDIDQEVVNGILKKLMPRGWKRHAAEISCNYTHKLRQMIAIESATGSNVDRIVGYVESGIPALKSTGLIDEDVAAKAENFIGGLRGLNRSERMTLPFILLNLVAAYGYAVGEAISDVDDTLLEEIYDGFVANEAIPNVAAKAYAGGVACLDDAVHRILDDICINQNEDGSWSSSVPNDDVHTTLLALNALIYLVPYVEYDLSREMESAMIFVMSTARSEEVGVSWEGGAFFSAGVGGTRKDLIWRSDAYTTALAAEAIAGYLTNR